MHLNSDGSTSMYFCVSSEDDALTWVDAFKAGTTAPAMPMGAHVDMLQRRKTVGVEGLESDSGIVWEGWLYKKQVGAGKTFRATMLSPWKKRWFELSQDKFTYRKTKDEKSYGNKNDGKDRSVPLSCCTVERIQGKREDGSADKPSRDFNLVPQFTLEPVLVSRLEETHHSSRRTMVPNSNSKRGGANIKERNKNGFELRAEDMEQLRKLMKLIDRAISIATSCDLVRSCSHPFHSGSDFAMSEGFRTGSVRAVINNGGNASPPPESEAAIRAKATAEHMSAILQCLPDNKLVDMLLRSADDSQSSLPSIGDDSDDSGVGAGGAASSNRPYDGDGSGMVKNSEGKVTFDTEGNHVVTPLYAAARHGDALCTRQLLEVAASVEERGEEMVRIAAMVHQQGVDLAGDEGADAALGGDHHELLLKMLCFKDGHDYHPLHAAARGSTRGHSDCVELLLQASANFSRRGQMARATVEAPNNRKRSDTNVADNDQLSAANLANQLGRNGRTPLHVASNTEVVGLLLRAGAEMEMEDDAGITPAMNMARHGNHQGLRALLDMGGADANIDAALSNSKNEDPHNHEEIDMDGHLGNGKLFHAGSLQGHGKLTFTWRAPVDANRRSWKAGNTALHWASSNGHHECARLLLERGADQTIKNLTSFQPLHCAAGSGHVAVVKVLIEAGTAPLSTSPSPTAGIIGGGGSPGGKGGASSPVPMMAKPPSSAELLARQKLEQTAQIRAPINEPTKLGLTPLLLAIHAASSATSTAKSEARSRASVGGSSITPLQQAVYATVQLLLEAGADPNVRDRRGQRPLHGAAHAGAQTLVALLVEQKRSDGKMAVEVNKKDDQGYTALELVERKLARGGTALRNYEGLKTCSELLKKHGAVRRAHANRPVEEDTASIKFSRNNKDGTQRMRAGTIEAIVDRLTHETLYSASDVRSFLFQYHKFISARELIAQLRRSIKVVPRRERQAKSSEEEVVEGATKHHSLGAVIHEVATKTAVVAGFTHDNSKQQNNVLSILEHWLEAHNADLLADPDVCDDFYDLVTDIYHSGEIKVDPYLHKSLLQFVRLQMKSHPERYMQLYHSDSASDRLLLAAEGALLAKGALDGTVELTLEETEETAAKDGVAAGAVAAADVGAVAAADVGAGAEGAGAGASSDDVMASLLVPTNSHQSRASGFAGPVGMGLSPLPQDGGGGMTGVDTRSSSSSTGSKEQGEAPEPASLGLRGISISEEGEEGESEAAAAAAFAEVLQYCHSRNAGQAGQLTLPVATSAGGRFSIADSSAAAADLNAAGMPSLVVPASGGSRSKKGKGRNKGRASVVALQAFQDVQKADEASHFGKPDNYEQLRQLSRQSSTSANKAAKMMGSPHPSAAQEGGGGDVHASGLRNMSATSGALAVSLSGTGGLLKLNPIDIARQITVAQHSLFSEIMPSELLNSNFSRKKRDKNAPNFVKMSAFHEQLGAWVQNQILGEKDIKTRAEMLSLMVRTADCCVTPLSNYDGAVAIVSALNANPLHRLKKTWERALRPKQGAQITLLSSSSRGKSEDVCAIWERLSKMMASGARKLVVLMQGANLPCVPYIGAICDELVSTPLERRNRQRRNCSYPLSAVSLTPTVTPPPSSSLQIRLGEYDDNVDGGLINFTKIRQHGEVIIKQVRSVRCPSTQCVVYRVSFWLITPSPFVSPFFLTPRLTPLISPHRPFTPTTHYPPVWTGYRTVPTDAIPLPHQ
jgi:ankyrin repeat protein